MSPARRRLLVSSPPRSGRLGFAALAATFALLLLVEIALAPPALAAAPLLDPDVIADVQGRRYRLPKVDEAPTVDGRLDDAAWKDALELELEYEIWPSENLPSAVSTRVWMLHDDSRLYVAFHARDHDPATIRARLSDRDEIWSDDRVGFVVDPYNDERRAFEFFVNPLGVQMDRFVDGLSGREDSKWDALWSSAGRIVDDGYVVEIAVPFASLSFPATAGGEQTWAFDLQRSWPRSRGHYFSLVPRNRDLDCNLCQYPELQGFEGIAKGRDLELVPTAVLSQVDSRSDDTGELESGDVENDLGLTVRWGMTPSLTLSGTLNPDFSQVEADVAQLDVNRRFALFFPETRPFFLEGADFFDTEFSVVQTRSIADPDWGAKLTGKQGSNSIGVFAAQDAVTGLLLPGSQSSRSTLLEETNLSSVVRYRRDLGQRHALGMIATVREGEEYFNRVVGADGYFRLTGSDSLRFQLLGSSTRYPGEVAEDFDQPTADLSDTAWTLGYRHDDRNWEWGVNLRDIGADFRADLGFMPRVDERVASGNIERNWRGDADDWWTGFQVGGGHHVRYSHDDERLGGRTRLSFRLSGPWQSSFNLGTSVGDELFDGVRFDQHDTWMGLSVRPNASFSTGLDAVFGDEIDYANTRPGEQLRLRPRINLSLGQRLRLGLNHTWNRLDVDRGTLFTANLSEMRVVYQLNLRTFVRAVVQYQDVERDAALYESDVDAVSRSLLNQLLFSYKLSPQTVLFLGYSDSQLGQADNPDLSPDLDVDERTLFFKVGYAFLL